MYTNFRSKTHNSLARDSAHDSAGPLTASSEFNTPRIENTTNSSTTAQEKAATRGGQRGALHFSVSFPYSQRIQPPPPPPAADGAVLGADPLGANHPTTTPQPPHNPRLDRREQDRRACTQGCLGVRLLRGRFVRTSSEIVARNGGREEGKRGRRCLGAALCVGGEAGQGSERDVALRPDARRVG